jgi:hypothetical protein
MLWWLLWACAPGSTSEVAAPASRAPGWTVLVWMDGDNNLESLVPGDLNELERAVGDDVRVLVQADRIPGYSRADGNWTGTRRYEMVADDTDAVVSPVVADLGEVDMGSADALADFLAWGEAYQPSERVALVLWNHGGGFWIASDDTSGSHISLVGELESALMPLVETRGAPLDVVAFDACNMGQWETAVALRNTAQVAVASQAWSDRTRQGLLQEQLMLSRPHYAGRHHLKAVLGNPHTKPIHLEKLARVVHTSLDSQF